MASVSKDSSSYFQTLQSECAKLDHEAVDRYAELVFEAWRDDRQVLVFGNGGSAFTASHHVADYVKTATVPGQRNLRALSLSDNTGILTALGNDFSYDDTFAYPLQVYGRPGDLAIAISCSGNSPNVVKACELAKENGLTLVCLTGFSGGKIAPLADVHVHVASDNYGVIEDIHMSLGHVVAQSLFTRVSALAVT